MTIISLIAAMDENRGIGKNNQLLCHLPADLKHFKELTIGKPIIMGHGTFNSIGKPLPHRLNIVLSRQNIVIDGVVVVDSLAKALALTKEQPEVMMIGGADLFQQSLPFAHRLYLTIIHAHFDADVYFPLFDSALWICKESDHKISDEKNAYDMTFYRYDRI